MAYKVLNPRPTGTGSSYTPGMTQNAGVPDYGGGGGGGSRPQGGFDVDAINRERAAALAAVQAPTPARAPAAAAPPTPAAPMPMGTGNGAEPIASAMQGLNVAMQQGPTPGWDDDPALAQTAQGLGTRTPGSAMGVLSQIVNQRGRMY